jgi:hypothetical protein
MGRKINYFIYLLLCYIETQVETVAMLWGQISYMYTVESGKWKATGWL